MVIQMAEIVYILCGLFSILCAGLLLRSYSKNPSALLLWSGIAFGFLALNNIILVIDVIIFPQVEMNGPLLRAILSSSAGTTLLFGLIWELT